MPGSISELAAAGDPVDADLVALLAAEGLEFLPEIRELGRRHFAELLAERAGFSRDFESLLAELELTWEAAADAERFRCPLDEMEIGVAALVVAEKLGAEQFADVFRHPRDTVMLAMAERDGLLFELDALLARHGLAW